MTQPFMQFGDFCLQKPNAADVCIGPAPEEGAADINMLPKCVVRSFSLLDIYQFLRALCYPFFVGDFPYDSDVYCFAANFFVYISEFLLVLVVVVTMRVLMRYFPYIQGRLDKINFFLLDNFVFCSHSSAMAGYNRAMRRQVGDFSSKEVRVVDGNRFLNVAELRRLYRRGEPFDVSRLHGRTEACGLVLPFPVYCDKKTLIRFCEEFATLPNFWRRELLVSGIMSKHMIKLARPLFAPILDDHSLATTASAGFDWPSEHFPAVLCGLVLPRISLFFSAWLLVVQGCSNVLGWTAETLPYVCLEELLNSALGVHIIVIYETLSRFHLGPRSACIVACLHLVLCCIPFPIRVFVHKSWNSMATLTDKFGINRLLLASALDDEYLYTCIEDVSYAFDLVRKILKGDKVGLVYSIGMKAHVFKLLRDVLVEVDSPDVVADRLCATFDQCSRDVGADGEQIFLCNSLPPELFRWLPKNVTHSPTFSRVSAFVGLILFSKFFSSYSSLSWIGATITSDDFVEGVDLATVVSSAATAVARAFKRVMETGSPAAFFEKPRDLSFIEESMDLLYAGDVADDEKRLLGRIANANRLIVSRSYEKNTPLIERTLLELRKFVKEKMDYCRAWSPRLQPMLIWLNGAPGTGKSTIMQAIQDVIMAADDDPHFIGDSINYQLYDKYPTSTGANELARHLIVNDIADDYTDFPNRDLMPLEITMQQVLDTTPYSPRAAAIEDKGKVYSKLKTMIMTSNHKSYKFSSATEKLERRCDSGVIVEVFVVDEKGAPVSYKTFGAWPPELRNTRLRYRVLQAKCFNLHVKLEDTNVVYDLPGFLGYVKQRWVEHKARFGSAAVNFSAESERCSCGVSVALHRVDGPYGQNWRPLGDMCIHPLVEVVEPMQLEPYDLPLPATLGVADDVMNFCSRASPEEKRNFALLPVLLFLADFSIFSRFAFWLLQIWWILHLFPSDMTRRLQDMVYTKMLTLEGDLANWALDNPVANRCMETLARDLGLERARIMTVARRRWNEFLAWINKYKWWIALAAGGAATYLLYSRLSQNKDANMTLAKPIYAENVIPGSFGISGYTSQQSFPAEVRAGWQKSDSEMKVASITTFGVSREALVTVCQANMVRFELKLPFGPRDATGLFLTPEVIAFNKHYLHNDARTLSVSDLDTCYIKVDDSVTEFKRKDLRSDPSSEFFLLKLSFSSARRGLLRFLLKEDIAQACDIEHIRIDGTIVKTVAHPTSVTINDIPYKTLEWEEPGVRGMCSEPVIGIIGGNAVLLGCVSYAKLAINRTGCSLFSRSWFDRCMESEVLPLVEDIVFELPTDKPISGLSLKSEFRNVANRYSCPVGTYDGPARSMKSKLKPTRVHDFFKRFLKKDYVPPGKLKGIGLDGEYHSAVTHTFANIDKSCDLTQEESNLVVSAMLEDIAPAEFVRENNIKLSPLSLKESIFGKPELNIGRTDFSTSVGPFVKAMGISNKYEMFEMIDDQLETYALKPEIKARYDKFEEVFSSGRVLSPFSDMAAKDELRPIEKVGNFKIRLFFVLDVVFNLFARRYLMPLIVYLLGFPARSECYGGMNAGSHEWDDLARRLLTSDRSGRKFADFDFSTFDTTHHQMLFQAMAAFFYEFSKRVGYSEEEAKVVYFIFVCFKWQIVSWMNDLMIKFKGMPSGVIFTLIFNSMVNSFLMRLCYLRLVKRPLKNFKKDVITANVGDDNINSICNTVAEQFNIITVAKCLEGVGYIATPAKKGAITAKWLEFEELTFLKRSFRWCPVIEGYVAPIEEDSIWRPFTYQQEDAGMSSAARLQEVARNALHESMLYGRDYFNEAQRRLVEGFAPHGLIVPEVSYDALVSQYKEGDFRTFGLAEEIPVFLGHVKHPNLSEPSENNKSGQEVMHGITPLSSALMEIDTTLLPVFEERNLPQFDCPECFVQAIADFNANNNSGVSTEIGGVTSVVAESSQVSAPGFPRYVDVTTRPSDYRDFTTHFVQVDHRTVTPASTVTITISNNILALLLTTIAAQPVGRKLENMVWSRSKIKIKIVVQGAPYAAGQVVATFMPNVKLSSDISTAPTVGSETNKVNCKIVPHLILDPSKTETYELTLPVCTPSGTWYLYDPTELGSYRYDMVFFNPIFSGTAVSPTVNICTYAAFETESFEAITTLASDFVEEKKPGFLSSAAHTIAKYSPLAAIPFPEFAPGITLFSAAAQGVGDFLYYLGFSKPPATDNQAFALNRVVDNYSQSDGISTAIVLAGSQTTSLGLSAAHGGGTDEELLLANLCKKKGLIKQISIPASAASGTRVANIRVHPTYIAAFGSTANGSPTPLAGVAIPFLYWSGDILLTMEVVASVFNRCTLLVAWDALAGNPSIPPTMEKAMQTLPNTVVSVAGNTSVEFRIPWAQHKPWRTVCRYKSDQDSGLSTPNTFLNGEVFVYVVNPLTSNGSVDPIAVNFYFSSDNIRFAMPSASRLPIQVMSAGNWSQGEFATLESLEEEDPLVEDRYDSGVIPYGEAITTLATDLVAPVQVAFGPKTENFYLFQRTFGDLVASVKGLTSRHGFLNKGTFAAPGSSAIGIQMPNLSAPVGTAMMVSGGVAQNFLGYFAQAYLGYRGGVRHMFHVHDVTVPTTGRVHHSYWVTHDTGTVPSSTGIVATTLNMTGVTTSYAYSAMNRDLALNSDFVAPMMIPYDFLPRGYTSALSDYVTLVVGVMSGTDTFEMSHAVASADDGNFVWFLGFPPSPFS
jgi:hypothetical protein